MTVWERRRVLALAPDAAAAKAATALLTAGRWSETGRQTDAGTPLVWGACQGSGGAPYAVVARAGVGSSCTCPSRKSPCKHALALLLRWSADELAEAEPPAYATRWAASRGAEKPERPAKTELADPEGAAVRAAARVERVTLGLAELDVWLNDQLRTGLAGLERAGYAHFDAVAARMVDAQAPGVAAMLRAVPAELGTEGWPERVLDALAAVHLLVQAHRHLDALPDDLAATVRSRVGYPVTKESVLSRPGVLDHWWVLGLVDEADDRLETRRVWLRGVTTGRWAVVLSYAVQGGALDTSLEVGDLVHALVHPYPGAGQDRVLVGERWPLDEHVVVTGSRPDEMAETLVEARARFAARVAADPWAGRMPAVISALVVPPSTPGEPWRLADPDGTCVDLVDLVGEPWPLLAHGAGGPLRIFGEWQPRGFRPVRALAGDGEDARRPDLVGVG